MIFYKSYPFAPKASLFSALSAMLSYLALIGAIVCVALGVKGTPLLIVLGVVLLAVAGVVYFLVYRKLIPEKAKAESQKNITTKGSFAAMYCHQHPEAYEQLMQTNADFAARYTKNEKGRIVKKK